MVLLAGSLHTWTKIFQNNFPGKPKPLLKIEIIQIMRDKKISILLFVSFLLLLASFLILCTWMYNYYTDNKSEATTFSKTPPQKSEVTRDSLLKIYTATIQSLESQLGNTYVKSDSIETGLSIKLDEYYKLKDELSVLLKKPAADDDFKLAKQKINELQRKMLELRSTSIGIERENARLQKIIESLSKGQINDNTAAENFRATTISSPGRDPEAKAITNPFTSSELNLTAVKDEETDGDDMFNTQKKIVGSFAVKNSINFENSEIIVVVTQPNGQVLQKSSWESGSFQSPDGKKIYSLKMSFGYTRGEAKKLTFLIQTDKFTRGNYTMQIYNHGKVIGRITRLLS